MTVRLFRICIGSHVLSVVSTTAEDTVPDPAKIHLMEALPCGGSALQERYKSSYRDDTPSVICVPLSASHA